MAYEKTTWANGDVVTSEKLNHIESGIEGAGALAITQDTLNAFNARTISEAVRQGRLCIMYNKLTDDDAEGVALAYVISVMHDAVAGKYIVTFALCNPDATTSSIRLAADTLDGELTPYNP